MKNPTRSREELFTIEDDPEIMQLNFPPTEIEESQGCTFLPVDNNKLQYFLYPSNVSRRDYQYEIVEECIHQNTLVCLPTGSGKTLIAAVVMMNFRKWYPEGKIIFMAPFRTLVTQQIDACMSLTDIKENEVSILTGTTFTGSRIKEWKEKSIFFCTPQIVQNDLSKNVLNPCSISLLIIDEAHHANGNYAYVNVVRMVAAYNSQFRVVGLSATPGSDVDKIQAVIYNLMISKIIYKDEDDIDISKYQHKTDIEIVKVPLGNDESKLEDYLLQCITEFAKPLDKRGYIKLTSSPKWMTHGVVWRAMDQFKTNNNRFQIPDFFKIMDSFGTLLTLATMQEKLTKYGAAMLNDSIKDFIKKKKESECKKKLLSMPAFQQLQQNCETSKNVSHPKLAKLSEILGDFYSENTDSRTIVFTKYRDAALAIVNCLKKVKGVKASIFIGKSDTRKNHGLDETTQIEIVSLFRQGNINCIVATSVAEEGLDIGEVDLIICYDTSSSPKTTVQRMGRTGRKRSGKVIFLMSEGYEEKNLEKAQYTRSIIKKKLTTAIGNFILYKPEKPNLPIPENCKAFNIPCAKLGSDKSKVSSIIESNFKKKSKFDEGNAESIKQKPYLSKQEMTWLQCCYDSQSYRSMNVNDITNVFDYCCKSICHSAESDLLFTMKENLSLSNDIEKQLDDLIKEVESNNSRDQISKQNSEKSKKSKNPFFIDSSDSTDSDTDIEEVSDFSEKDNSSSSPSTPPILLQSNKPEQNSSLISTQKKQQSSTFQTKQSNTQKISRNQKLQPFGSKINDTKSKKQIQKQLVENMNFKVVEKNQSSPMKFIPVRQLVKMKQTDLSSFVSNENDVRDQEQPVLELNAPKFLDSDDDDFAFDENSNEINDFTDRKRENDIQNHLRAQSRIFSFLSDEDDENDFDEVQDKKEEMFFKSNSSDEQAESECPDIIAVKRELGKKPTPKFLNDSELDSFDFDEYFK